MRKGLFFFSCLIMGTLWCQATSVRGLIAAPAGTQIQLYSMRQHKSELLGSTLLGKDSIFLLAMPANAYQGFYLLRWQQKEIEFLYDGQAISFQWHAAGQPEVIRGSQWKRYLEQKALLVGLRKKEAAIAKSLDSISKTAFGYDKMLRKNKRNARKQHALYKSLKREKDQLWSRTLAFEWHWLERSGAFLRRNFSADSLLQLIPLSDTLALYHNRWPGFMRMYFSAYAPVDSQPLAPLLLRCSAALLAKAKTHPAYLPATIDFLQWGMEQFEATEAMQLLGKEKALFTACGNTNLANQQASFSKPLVVGDSLPLESLVALGAMPADALRAMHLFVFWSSECPPCVIEFDQLHRWMKHNRPDLEVLAIALQHQTQSWNIEKQAFDGWKHLLDSKAWQGQVALDWQITHLPLYVLSDQKGRITGIYHHTAALRKALEP